MSRQSVDLIPLKNFIKIWLTKDPTVFAPGNIKERLKDFVQGRGAGETVTIFYNSRLLDQQSGSNDFNLFSEELTALSQTTGCSVVFTDISSQEFSASLESDTERELHGSALEECDLTRGGNLAAASDILRILSPCYKRGAYTDTDVYVQPGAVNLSVSAADEASIRFPIFADQQGMFANNDFVYIPVQSSGDLSQRTQQHVVQLQQIMKRSYDEFDFNAYFKDSILKLNITNDQKVFLVKMIMEKSQAMGFAFHGDSYPQGVQSLHELRCVLAILMEENKEKPGLFSYLKLLYMDTVMKVSGPLVFQRFLSQAAWVTPLEYRRMFGFSSESIYTQTRFRELAELSVGAERPALPPLYQFSAGGRCDASWVPESAETKPQSLGAVATKGDLFAASGGGGEGAAVSQADAADTGNNMHGGKNVRPDGPG